jgi:hypothetical protein
MKKIILAALVGIISFIGLSFVPAASDPTVVIKKGVMKINGVNVTADWSLSNFKKALGEPDRTRDGYNKTHTYDKKSIVLFEKMSDKKPSGTVSEAQFYFHVAESNNVTPDGPAFSGTIKVDKLVVSRNLSATTMLAKLKKWEKTDSYIEHSYRMASKGIYIYFQFNDSEDKLVKISVGPDKKK